MQVKTDPKLQLLCTLNATIHKQRKQNVIVMTQIGMEKLINQSQWHDTINTNFMATANNSNSNRFSNFGIHNSKKRTLFRRNKLFNSVSGDMYRTAGHMQINTNVNQYNSKSIYNNSNVINRDSFQNNKAHGKSIINKNQLFMQSYPGKIVRKQQIWNQTRQKFNKTIKKEYSKHISDKYKQIQWAQTTKNCKNSISDIIQGWQNCSTSQKSRKQQRLKSIYFQKYLSNLNNKKQKVIHYEQRSFLQPRVSKINYGNQVKGKQNKKQQFLSSLSKKNVKVYYKMLNQRNLTQK